VDVNPPKISEQTLEGGGADNQRWIFEQRAIAPRVAKRRIDAVLDQPGQGDAREIRRDQRENAQDEKAAVAINQELDAMVMAKNRSVL